MRYSIEPTERRYVKVYEILSFARNLNNKYGQKLVDSAIKSSTDALKIAGKRAIQKTAEVTGDPIGNKIADKITRYLKKPENEQMILAMKHKKKDIYLYKKDKKLLMN